MLHYYMDFWKKYVCFHGRARRAAFWYAMLMNFILLIVLNVLMNRIPVFYYLYYLYDLALLIPTIALGVRRLHDIGKSGLWYLLILVPVAGPIILLVWFCRLGDYGENAYGPDPKATGGCEIL